MISKKTVVIAALLMVLVAVGGYFLVGPGSGSGYGDSYTDNPGVSNNDNSYYGRY